MYKLNFFEDMVNEVLYETFNISEEETIMKRKILVSGLVILMMLGVFGSCDSSTDPKGGVVPTVKVVDEMFRGVYVGGYPEAGTYELTEDKLIYTAYSGNLNNLTSFTIDGVWNEKIDDFTWALKSTDVGGVEYRICNINTGYNQDHTLYYYLAQWDSSIYPAQSEHFNNKDMH